MIGSATININYHFSGDNSIIQMINGSLLWPVSRKAEN